MPKLPDAPEPFRAGIPADEFTHVEGRVRPDIDVIQTQLVTTVADRPAGAALMLEVARDPVTPREARSGIFRCALDLMQPDGDSVNDAIAQLLIEDIRATNDAMIRTRNAGILAHALQERYLPETTTTTADRDAIARWGTRVAAVEQVVRNPAIDPATRAWARAVRTPTEYLAVLANLYHRDPDAEIAQPIEEIVTDADGGGATTSPSPSLTFQDLLVHLDPRFLPSAEKVDAYRRITGRPLPIAISRQQGARLVSIHLPPAISQEVLDIVERFRVGVASRQDVANAAGVAAAAFSALLAPEQRAAIDAAIASGTLSVRFTTQRDQQLSPDVPLVADNTRSAPQPPTEEPTATA